MSGPAAPVLLAGQWRQSQDGSGANGAHAFQADDPDSGEAFGTAYPISGERDLETAIASACAVVDELAAADPAAIVDFLERYADAIEANRESLAALAQRETGLPVSPRFLGAEIPRTCGQLRLAAEAARSHAWTLPTIDTRNGLRAWLAPLGKPVLVLGPGNFPFAFNAISGSDFASALVARTPVIAKAHPGHPGTSEQLARLAHEALVASGLPAASVQMLYQLPEALGLRAAGDARIGAVAFTGSRAAGVALKRAADAAGVLFYGELSSINPVLMLPGALAARAETLAQELLSSCTLGAGQFCTNPGLVLVPEGNDGDVFVDTARRGFAEAPEGLLLSRGGQRHLRAAVEALIAAGATPLAGGGVASGGGFRCRPVLLSVDGERFLAAADALQREAFGPVTLLVRVRDPAQMDAIIRTLEGQLTGTIYLAEDGSDADLWRQLAPPLRAKVGRLIANRMPTGVAVSAAMNHGGPWPSASHPGFSSVGMPGAIRRFAALHSYDQVPDALLPAPLRNRNPGRVPRLVDGSWTDRDLEMPE
ncbi:aldehyde dehydrogenase family protein [Pseudoxanthomonas sp. 22568]|uniref:aldehyde dehydrogenase family protein n=1 Tax=Pseudoxanthomonas sp. 22568 TaxID=3453945 RepID=UPI003F8434B7